MTADGLKRKKRQIARMMQKNIRLWSQMGYGPICDPPMGSIAEAAVSGLNACLERTVGPRPMDEKKIEGWLKNYGAACQCYYLGSCLHQRTDQDTKTAVLLGDYLFGECSRFLIPLNSTRLIELFARRMQEEAKNRGRNDLGDYLRFVAGIPEQFVVDLL